MRILLDGQERANLAEVVHRGVFKADWPKGLPETMRVSLLWETWSSFSVEEIAILAAAFGMGVLTAAGLPLRKIIGDYICPIAIPVHRETEALVER